MADKIVSFLSSNDILYERKDGEISFNVSNLNKQIKIYYLDDRFYIDQENYKGQPHIIRNDRTKYWLCLTMDGSDRRDNILNSNDKIKRIEEIVFELWKDPIAERFRELNVYLQTPRCNLLYFDYDEKLRKSIDNSFFSIENIIIEYKGQKKDDILNNFKVKNSENDPILLSFRYKKKVKRVLLDKKAQKFYKINDFSKESFWGRTGMIKEQKNIKLIGLGSIGGLVLDFLCKAGYQNIDIYDYDVMDVVNNPRHVLGIPPDKIGINKTKHLSDHYSKLFPMIKIKPKPKFCYQNEILDDGDLIINTTGGPISVIKNNFIKLLKNKKNFTHIDIFVEPFGLGVHGIVINSNSNSKDKDIFLEKCKENKRYIVTNKKDFRENFDGCFTPTLPYGFAPLQISIPWFMTIMMKNNFIDNHYIIPFLQLLEEKKEFLNEELSKDINPLEIKVNIWRK